MNLRLSDSLYTLHIHIYVMYIESHSLYTLHIHIYIYSLLVRLFVLAVLGLRCCAGFFLVVVSGGYSPVAVHGLLIAVAFLGFAISFSRGSSPPRD